ncbi:MAG: imidazole glycerol phosphate synthase subunit HisH, partial [Candidatus Omnitrophica bacterium]|nr:imidazole glycerol phosphate synthase subunit HisH [Candidatus Omnitrophota bacterium]
MIAIIDYKMGNVRSVAKAFESVGAAVMVTASVSRLRAAKALVLPGVGAFSAGMKNLRVMGVIPEIKRAAVEQKPFLGICLGMQLLFTT